MKRVPLKKALQIDFTKPVDKAKLMKTATGCFGKAWDISSRECPKCSGREACHILYKDLVEAKVKKLEKDRGATYLDTSNFKALSKGEMFGWIESGKTTTKDLIAHVQTTANTSDKVSVIEWIKQLITSTDKLYTKDGVVWKR